MIQTTKYGIYHGVNEGYCSWYEFAKAIFKEANKIMERNSVDTSFSDFVVMTATDIDIKVNPIPTEKYPTRAKRPLNSRLSKGNLDKNGFNRLPSWEDALVRYLKEIVE